jgi:hypothetical protein
MIFREIEDRKGITIGGVNINNLRYADDTVLMADNEQDLQELLQTVKEKSECYGLHMNIKRLNQWCLAKRKRNHHYN